MSYEIMKDFQGAIAAVFTGAVGFSGVILTLNRNAKIARDARAETIAHTERTVRTALLEELRAYHRIWLHFLNTLDKMDGYIILPAPFGHDVYNALMKDIGVLNADQVGAVIDAHMSVDAYMSTLQLLAHDFKGFRAIHPSSGNILSAKYNAESLLKELTEAIDSLSDELAVRSIDC